MKSLSKKLLTATLVLSMLIPTFASCGSPETDTSADTTAVTETESVETEPVYTIPEPDLPDLDYNNEDFTYLNRSESFNSYVDEYIYAEEENGEIINDTVYRRNALIEEHFNIDIKKISPLEGSGWGGEMENLVRQYIIAGDNGIDVISNMRNSLSALALEGHLYNFLDIKYINTDAEYWDQKVKETVLYRGNLYMMPCDISMRNFDGTFVTYFNQAIIDDYGMESPYTLVRENKWTLDTMLSMVSQVSEDVNGDLIYDINDRYGLLSEDSNNGTLMHLLTASGYQMFEKDADDNISVVILNELVDSVFTKYRSTIENGNCSMSAEAIHKAYDTSQFSNAYQYTRKLFSDGHFLFYLGALSTIDGFRDMEQTFGIVPNPKYNEDQAEYYHRVDMWAPIFGVPHCTADLDRVGAVMEYSAWLSNQMLLPAYYEVKLKAKAVQSEDAAEMLDLIKGSHVYEFNIFYGLSTGSILWDAYVGENLASVAKSRQKTVEYFLKDLNQKLDALN